MINTFQRVLFLCLTLTLTACYSGNEESFTEAVEISELNIASIYLSSGDMTIEVNQVKTIQALAEVTDSAEDLDVTSRVTWSSSDASVASVSSAGLITGLADGTSTITASIGNLRTSLDVTVSSAPLISVAVTGIPSSPNECSTSYQLSAEGNYGPSDTRDINDLVTWSTDDSNVAAIDADGILSVYATGSSDLTATYTNNTAIDGMGTVNVADNLDTITITPATGTMNVSTSQQYLATGTYTDTSTSVITDLVTWSSSPTDGASSDHLEISNTSGTKGLATALTTGDEEISATCNTAENSIVTANVTIEEALVINDIEIFAETAGPYDVSEGSIQLFARLKFSDGSNGDTIGDDDEDITWSASFQTGTIAEVSDDVGTKGLVTFTAEGTTEIRVFYDSDTYVDEPFEATFNFEVE